MVGFHTGTIVVPTDVVLAQVTGAFGPTEAAETLKEVEEPVTEAPAPAATEAAVVEAEKPSAHTEDPVVEAETPSAHTKVPVVEAETPSAHTKVPVVEAETPSVHTEVPVKETEAPSVHTTAQTAQAETTEGVTEAPAKNTETTVEAEDAAATEATPEVIEVADETEAPKTGLSITETVLNAEADQVIEIEGDEVEMEDSEGEILTQTYIYNIWQILVS